MNRLFALLLLGVALAKGAPLPPSNVVAEPTATAVDLTWDMVDDATGYMVTIENITSQTTQNNRINIGGLMPRTMYTAMIKSVMDEEASEVAVEISFKTRVEGVQNLRVEAATETSIEVTWDEIDDATSYTVLLESSQDNSTEMDLNTVETTATFVGLSAITFYDIFVTATTPDGSGDATMLKARTDGSGVVVDGVWKNGNSTFGGQIQVFRPLTVPKGSYSIRVSIPCPMDSADIWNAEENKDLSDLFGGVLVATQKTSWQLEKTEIGMNFMFNEDFNCTFGTEETQVEFGVDIPSSVNESIADLPIVQSEWVRQETVEVYQGGLVRFLLNELYTAPNEELEDGTNKPPVYSFVIALNPGPDCPLGVNIRAIWSMSLKNTEGIEGTQPGYMYFTQEGSNWYSNEAGFLYGYNPETCSDRSGMTAEILVGGDLVNRICNAPDTEITN